MALAVKTENLYYTYEDGTRALNGIDLTVKTGEKVAVMGANGSGKSTFFLTLNGVLKPEKGRVFISGKPIRYSGKGLLEVRKKVGIVFQNPDDQLFSASVKQDISFGLFNLGLSREEVEYRTVKIMEMCIRDSSIIRELVDNADEETRAELEILMDGGTIEKPVHEEITYGDIHTTKDSLWNFDQKIEKLDRSPLMKALEEGDCETVECFLFFQKECIVMEGAAD